MKKTIITVLVAVCCILLVAEGKDFMSTIIIKAVAVFLLWGITYLWRRWRLGDDKTIKRLTDD